MMTDEKLKRMNEMVEKYFPGVSAIEARSRVIAALIIADSNNGIEFSLDKMTKLISENLNNIAFKM